VAEKAAENTPDQSPVPGLALAEVMLPKKVCVGVAVPRKAVFVAAQSSMVQTPPTLEKHRVPVPVRVRAPRVRVVGTGREEVVSQEGF